MSSRDNHLDERAFIDTLYVIGGKWKLSIIHSICKGNKRFSDIEKSIPGITRRMLSRELKDMEMNNIISRTVKEDFAIGIEYTFTDYAQTLNELISEAIRWGQQHRKEIGKSKQLPAR